MKRLKSLAATCTALVIIAPSANAAEAVYGVITNEKAGITKSVKAYLEEVNKTMPGGYEYNLVTGGALIGAGTEVPGFRDGIVDGGMITVLYTGSDLPITNMIANASLLSNDSRAAAGAFAQTTLLDCPECLDELVDSNIMPIVPYATDPYSILCREPVETLADFKGRKIRAVGNMGGLAVALGAVPVNVTIGEIYEGLQRGQVDCTAFALGGAISYSYHDVAPYILDLRVAPASGPTEVALRYDLWQSMDKETRQVFLDAAAAATTLGVYDYFSASQNVVNNPDNYKVTVTQPTDEIQAVVEDFTKTDLQALMDKARERGVKDPEKIIDIYRTALEKWNGILADIGDDQAAYTAALQREIYDKFPIDR